MSDNKKAVEILEKIYGKISDYSQFSRPKSKTFIPNQDFKEELFIDFDKALALLESGQTENERLKESNKELLLRDPKPHPKDCECIFCSVAWKQLQTELAAAKAEIELLEKLNEPEGQITIAELEKREQQKSSKSKKFHIGPKHYRIDRIL